VKRASVVLIVLLLLGSFSVSAFGADVKVGFIATNFSVCAHRNTSASSV
jgi:hypothetical protein